jgi:hypothetical protein
MIARGPTVQELLGLGNKPAVTADLCRRPLGDTLSPMHVRLWMHVLRRPGIALSRLDMPGAGVLLGSGFLEAELIDGEKRLTAMIPGRRDG